MTQHQLGFTLIEVLAAVAIVCLLSGAASLSLQGAHHQATFEDVVEKVIAADQVARQRALFRGTEVRIELEADRIKVTSGDEINDRIVVLPTNYELAATKGTGSRKSVVISRDGRSSSYAIKVEGDGHSGWVLVAGLSGETHLLDEVEVIAVWEQMSSLRFDHSIPPRDEP